ncbi:MAG: 4Fe-4S binding protein [Actinobacteria bacterium]|nr:4Fe-4S binding protein [Actinomycetota bacterium]
MGHGVHLGKEHRALADRLQHGSVAMVEPTDPAAKAAWQEILETLFTPDDAAVAAKMPVLPIAVERIAARLNQQSDRLRAHLDAMADKGLVLDLHDERTGEALYMLAPPVVGFFEFSMMRLADHLPKAKLAQAYHTYMKAPGFFDEVSRGDTVVGRALAHETALFGDLLSEVLDWERASALIDGASQVSVTNCYCRHKAHHLGTACETPMEMCMSLGGGAKYLISHGLAREIGREEAQEVLVAGREAGLVHIADNVQQKVSYICSCCSCCCEEMYSVRAGTSVVVPSGFQPSVDAKDCEGCSRCLRACPVDAISLVPRRAAAGDRAECAKQSAPTVDYARCIGCGVCVGACRRHCLKMERRSNQRRVPVNSVEFLVRAMLERGRLADLLIDGTAGRGPAFANAVLRTVLSLPPVDRLMASEQVRSRFVEFAMSRA